MMVKRRVRYLTIIAVIFFAFQICNYLVFSPPARELQRGLASQIGQEVPTTLSLKHRGPTRLVRDVNCKQIIEGDQQHISYANKVSKTRKFYFPNDDEIGNAAKNCDKFMDVYNYKTFNVSKEELDFPIAYTILTYKDAVQTEKLLSAIYRPHNIYCIHMDSSSLVSFHNSIKSISECFPNVFIASKLEDVVYAGFTRLQADLNCMSDLLREANIQWKYVINLPSQVYPLKTNAEIVKILQLYNGSSNIEILDGHHMRHRFYTSFRVKGNAVINTHKVKAPPLYDIKIGKGSAYGIFSREFVDYSINDVRAKYILRWLEDTYSPDEFFWATLALNKHLDVPGVLPNDKYNNKLWIAVSTMWLTQYECKGKFVRQVCVYGIGDLKKMVSEMSLFANKFYFDYQPFALQCMEEWHFNKSFSEKPVVNHHYIELLRSIKKH